MAQLSSYSAATSGVTDKVAREIRRLSGQRVVNVFDYMTDAQVADVISFTSAIDCAAACQAAIDAAYAAGIQTVYMPPGRYRWNSSVYLDPPQNLRAGPLSGTPGAWTSAFSMTLMGEPGLGNNENMGTRVRSYNATGSALWVGPGNGMRVSGITFLYEGTQNVDRQFTGSQRLLSSNVAGISIAGAFAGSSRTLIENCGIINFYAGIDADRNYDTLGDSITIRKNFIEKCRYGVILYGTQDFIVNIDDNSINNCLTAVAHRGGVRTVVNGGNFSTDSPTSATFTISSVSAITVGTEVPLGGGTIDTLTFTAVLTNPPISTVNPFVFTYLAQGNLFDVGAIKTTSYGVIPLQCTGWNNSTLTMTFKVWSGWITQHYPWEHPLSISDLETEIRAATKVYLTQWVKIFEGHGFQVRGLDIENQYTFTTLLDSSIGGEQSHITLMDGIYCNYDAGHFDLNQLENVWYPGGICQNVFPFIKTQSDAIFSGCQFGATNNPYPIIVEMYGNQNTVRFEDCRTGSVNTREMLVQDGLDSNVDSFATRTWGGIITDRCYWTGSEGSASKKIKGLNRHPYYGSRPAPYVIPKLLTSQVADMAAGTTRMAPVHGEAYYQVSDWSSGRRQYAFVKSASVGYSYPANLTLTGTWSTKGRSPVVVFSNSSDFAMMFVGLVIILNDGTTDRTMMVTGVYPGGNYITVTALSTTAGNNGFGTSGTTYTGTVIKQQGYQLQKFGRQCEFAAAPPSSTSVTYSVGDIVYNTAPVTGAYVGWVCTVSGAPGTWKPYGLIA